MSRLQVHLMGFPSCCVILRSALGLNSTGFLRCTQCPVKSWMLHARYAPKDSLSIQPKRRSVSGDIKMFLSVPLGETSIAFYESLIAENGGATPFAGSDGETCISLYIQGFRVKEGISCVFSADKQHRKARNLAYRNWLQWCPFCSALHSSSNDEPYVYYFKLGCMMRGRHILTYVGRLPLVCYECVL